MTLAVVALFAVSIRPADDSVAFKQPQLAAGAGVVGMTFGGGKAIYYASSSDGGRTFGKPVKVAETSGLMLGRHRGPRLAITRDALVISAVSGGELIVWRSVDRGESWVQTGSINDVPNAAREGLHAMTAGPDGKIYAAWLDLRAKGTRLYASRSDDGGRTWSKNVLAYSSPGGTICQCCHPTLVAGAQGRVFAMFRNVVDGNRDLWLLSSENGLDFRDPSKMGVGHWKLEACPMDGGGLAMSGGKPVSAWRRDGEVFVAAVGEPEQRVGSGKDVAIAAGKEGVWVAWSKGAALAFRGPRDHEAQELSSDGSFVNLLGLVDGGVVAAWEHAGSIFTRRLD